MPITKTEWDVIDPIWESGNYLLMGPINDASCYNAIKFINWHTMKPKTKLEHLTLIINSPGGDLQDALSLVDVMRTSRKPVHTLVIGEAASAGLLIAMAGLKGKRLISENAMILSHQYTWGASGTYDDLIAARKAQDMTDAIIIRHYIKCTGKSEEYIRKFLLPSNDVWLTPEEGVEHGLFDEIQLC